MGYFVKNRGLQSGSSGVVLPAGGTALRPLAPRPGLIRFNTDVPGVEFFNGVEFVQIAGAGSFSYVVDTFTGDGSTTVFTMTKTESSSTQMIVFVGSIYQTPVVAYTVDGGFDITFTSAPPENEPISVIHYIS